MDDMEHPYRGTVLVIPDPPRVRTHFQEVLILLGNILLGEAL